MKDTPIVKILITSIFATIIGIAALSTPVYHMCLKTIPPKPQPQILLPGLDTTLIKEQTTQFTQILNTPTKTTRPILTGTQHKIVSPYVSTHYQDGKWTLYTHISDPGIDTPYLAKATGETLHNLGNPIRVNAPTGFGGDVIHKDGKWYYTYWAKDETGWYGSVLVTSTDGINFTNPTKLTYHDHDITSLAWDDQRNRWTVMTSRFPGGDSTRTSWWLTGPILQQNKLQVMGCYTQPAPWDEGKTQFYGVDGWVNIGEYRIGLVKVMRDDITLEGAKGFGTGWTELIWSKGEGNTWNRVPGKFLAPSPESWDNTHAWGDEQIMLGDTTLLVYGGYSDGHKADRYTSRSLGMASFRTGRYVGLKGMGELVIGPVARSGVVSVDGDALVLNEGGLVEAGGFVRVRVDGVLWSVEVK